MSNNKQAVLKRELEWSQVLGPAQQKMAGGITLGCNFYN